MIDESYIERLRTEADSRIVDVVGHYVKLVNNKACCPFHDEKTPSFNVDTKKKTYTCYGCDAHGNAFDFVMNYNKLSFPETVKTLQNILGFEPVVFLANESQNPKNRLLPKIRSALNLASEIYIQHLTQTPDAIRYLKSRGITGQDVSNFHLGFAPATFTTILNGLKDHFEPNVLIEAGLLSEKNGRKFDFFAGRIMFPVRNEKGDVISFGGRRMDGVKEQKYLNGRATEVFDKGSVLYGLYESNQFISPERGVYNVVEGYMDVIASHRLGITNTVAGMGTALTEKHIRNLFNRCDKIRLIQDGDKAGLASIFKTIKTAAPLLSADKTVTVGLMPEGDDPDSLVCRGGRDALQNVISNEMPMSEFLVMYALNAHPNTAEGKAAAASDIDEIINLLTDKNLQIVLKNELYTTLNIRPDTEQTTRKSTTNSDELLLAMDASMLKLIQSFSPQFIQLCGIFAKHPLWNEILSVSELTAEGKQGDFLKAAIELGHFFKDKPISKPSKGALLYQYLVSVAPEPIDQQLQHVHQFQMEILNPQKKNENSLSVMQ